MRKQADQQDAAERFLALKKKVEQLREEEARARGELDATLKRVREELGVTDEGGLARLGKKLTRELAGLEAELSPALREFESKWAEVLEDV
jgi:hypothetical protein